MALKKISAKKMGEAFDEIVPLIRKGQIDMIMPVLKKYKIDVNTVDTYDFQFLYYIASGIVRSNPFNQEYIDAMKCLLDHGADINHRAEKGFTVLHMAANRNIPEAVQFLIDHGAEVDAISDIDHTPLDSALGGFVNDKPEAITTLLKAGADPYRKRRKEGSLPPAEAVVEHLGPNAEQRREVFFKALQEVEKAKGKGKKKT